MQSLPIPPFPKAVIFDWDNTLVDTLPLVHEALSETYRYMGRAQDAPSYEEMKGRSQASSREFFPCEFGEKWEEAQGFFYVTYRHKKQDKIYALPYVEDLLNLLAGQRVYMAVISNKLGEELRKEIQALGWGHFFSRAIGATDCVQDKPSPLCVDAALELLMVPHRREEVWFVGDNTVDYECASQAGCFSILVCPQLGCDRAFFVEGTQALYNAAVDTLEKTKTNKSNEKIND